MPKTDLHAASEWGVLASKLVYLMLLGTSFGASSFFSSLRGNECQYIYSKACWMYFTNYGLLDIWYPVEGRLIWFGSFLTFPPDRSSKFKVVQDQEGSGRFRKVQEGSGRKVSCWRSDGPSRPFPVCRGRPSTHLCSLFIDVSLLHIGQWAL